METRRTPAENKRARDKRYRERNRAKVNARGLAYYYKNKEKWAGYSQARTALKRQRLNAYYRAYYRANRRKCLEYSRKRYQRDPVRERARVRAYYLRTVEARRAYYRARDKRRKLDIEVDWACAGGCGRETHSTIGLCPRCRAGTCKRCGGTMRVDYIGQRVHEKCLGKE